MAEKNFLKMSNKQVEIIFLIAMIVLYFIVRLPFIGTLPLMKDEAIYSMMINEQMEHKTLLPTLFENPMPWKPPLFFWVYSMIVQQIINNDFFETIPLEVIYRVPTLFFGLINLILFYYIMKRIIGKGPKLLLTTFIFNIMLFTVYVTNTVLIDSLTFTFIFAALYCYLKEEWPETRFLCAGVFVFLGYMTKLLLAGVAPAVAIIYFFFKDKKTLSKPLFLLSLLAIVVGWFVFSSMFENKQLAINTHTIDIFGKLFVDDMLDSAKASFFLFFYTSNIWFALSLFGLYKFWKKEPIMSAWYAMILLPLFAAPFMPWHYFMIIPPITYFAALVLLYEKNQIKIDGFLIFGICIMLLINTVFTNYFYWDLKYQYEPGKEIGEFLAFKENVAIIGEYNPTIVANKILEEKRKNGDYLDFGWMFFVKDGSNKSKWDNDVVYEFVNNYYSDKYDAETHDGDFSMMFWKRGIYRKATEIKDFDYIVIYGYVNLSINHELLYNNSGIRVYKVAK